MPFLVVPQRKGRKTLPFRAVLLPFCQRLMPFLVVLQWVDNATLATCNNATGQPIPATAGSVRHCLCLCVSTAFVAKTPPSPCVSTAFVAKDTAVALCVPLPS